MLARTIKHATHRTNHVELLLGSCHANIAEPTLFFELRRFKERTGVRKHPLLHADHKNGIKFQSLGSMQRHERN